jgi:serine/threonine-protein kinase
MNCIFSTSNDRDCCAVSPHLILVDSEWAMIGRTLGQYRVVDKLGSGGMGDVYRAEDIRLGRAVALKVLREAFWRDEQRRARLSREARVLASLNHPSIAVLHGLEKENGVDFLVLELVEGETLAERIARGPLSFEEALALFRQIAEALEAAHAKGIVHRDLKPANIKITPEGNVKVLDFGLAKEFDEPQPASNLSESPTLTRGTEAGVILGTAPYMSPEQARGTTVDKRTDVWAFGCVLYEALTARRAFEGTTVTDVLAAIVRAEPRWERLAEDTPAKIRELLHRCLHKDARHRLRDIGEAWVAIEEARNEPAAPVVPVPRKSSPLAWTLAGLSALAAVAVWFRAPPQASTPPPVRRFTIERQATFRTRPVLSRNGGRLAYQDASPDGRRVFLRDLDQLTSRPIAGTEDSGGIFLSTDGKWIGFFTGRSLRKVSTSGGSPVTLSDAHSAGWGTWAEDGTVVYGSYQGGLFRISEEGGEPEELRPIDTDKGEIDIHLPEVLPDGEAIVYTLHRGGGLFRIEVLSLSTRSWHVLVDEGFSAQYSPTGHIVYSRSNLLFAVPFDLERLSATGPPVRMHEGLSTFPESGSADFDLSHDGTLVYVPETSREDRRLVWVAADGSEEPLDIDARAFRHPRLSPQGTALAVAVHDGERYDIWIYDLETRTHRRLTFEGNNLSPLWTSDGRRIAYSSERSGKLELFWQPADGSGAPEPLLSSDVDLAPGAWSSGGDLLAYVEWPPTDQARIGLLEVESRREKTAAIDDRSFNSAPRLSPDQKWLAFEMWDGSDEVYVTPFPSLQGRRQISTDGGVEPIWSSDGRTLYYRRGDNRIMAVPIRTEGTLETGRPRLLFDRRYAWSDEVFSPTPNWDVSPDRRFLMIRPSADELSARPIHVVLNWAEELKRRVPVER